MLPDRYHSQLSDLLATKYPQMLQKTVKTFKSRLRALDRDLDEKDLRKPVTMLQYRSQLATGTNNILLSLWKLLRETEAGMDLPDFVRRPVVMYPHPLFADVMLLGAVFGNERLPELTWGAVDGDFRFGESERQAAQRCLDWALLLNGAEHSPDTPLVPKDFQMVPMQLWQIEYIINSPQMAANLKRGYVKQDVCLLIGEFVFQSVRLNAEQSFLRFLCGRAHHAGNRVDEVDLAAFRKQANAATDPEHLMDLAAKLPRDKSDETPAMW